MGNLPVGTTFFVEVSPGHYETKRCM
jgi:hypothetical protein